MTKDHIKEYFKTNRSGGGQITNTPWIFTKLKLYMQNSDWHNMESVYDHTNEALSRFDSFYMQEITKWDSSRRVNDSLGEDIRRAIIWHDVGKIYPRIEGNKITYPGHEIVSSDIFYANVGLGEKEGYAYLGSKVRTDKKRFFSPKDEFVYELIRNHNMIHGIIKDSDFWSNLELLVGTLPHVKESCATKSASYCDWISCENPLYPKNFKIAFLHLGLADMTGSNLMSTRPAEYARRLENYAKAFEKLKDKN